MISAYFLQAALVLAAITDLRLARAAAVCHEPSEYINHRPHKVSLTDFGAVGDGLTLNTKAFQNAIFYLNSFTDKGGAELFVPAGKWLTGSFGLISHLTLSLDENAVIIASPFSADWPVIDPLPSYGQGRELPGKRYQSLLHGSNLTDVIITGTNGTIDGNGEVWWNWSHAKNLNYTRPHIVELMYSTGVVISNITIRNPPYWAVHPVYCSEVLVQFVTIRAPLDSPNTPGIVPDSCTNVCIQDCNISTGDDAIGIKSGWDEYGIAFAHPSQNISIRRIVGEGGLAGGGLSFGSEMSGGISGVHAEGLLIANSFCGIRVKTAPGRGGYVKDLNISDVMLVNVSNAICIIGDFDEHPDGNTSSALPAISSITIQNVVGTGITIAGDLRGIEGDDFDGICLSDITLIVSSNLPWQCSSTVHGCSSSVSPQVCEALSDEAVACCSGSCPRALRSSPASRATVNPFLGLASLSAAAAAAYSM